MFTASGNFKGTICAILFLKRFLCPEQRAVANKLFKKLSHCLNQHHTGNCCTIPASSASVTAERIQAHSSKKDAKLKLVYWCSCTKGSDRAVHGVVVRKVRQVGFQQLIYQSHVQTLRRTLAGPCQTRPPPPTGVSSCTQTARTTPEQQHSPPPLVQLLLFIWQKWLPGYST